MRRGSPDGYVLSTKSGQSATNPKEVVTSYAYDALNRRTRTDEAANGTTVETRFTTVVYDAANNVLSQTTGQGAAGYAKPVQTTYLYDNLNRQKSVTEAANDTAVPTVKRTTTTIHDPLVNIVNEVIDPLDHKTSYAYDALYRQIEVTQSAHLASGAARRTTAMLPDRGDLVKAVTDPLNHTTFYDYDGLNRRWRVVDAEQKATSTGYDRVGNVIGVLDAVGNLTTFNYDALNRVTSEINALPTAAPASRNPTRTFAYDASNNRTSVIDRNNRERRFGYDILNRVTTETWHTAAVTDRTLTTAYDAASNVLGGTERQGGSGGTILNQYSAGYDLLGRSTSSVTTYSLAPELVVNTASTFNAASERTQVAVTGTGSLTNNYQYDTLSRMNRIEQTGAAAAKLVTLTYNKLSQFTGISRYSDLPGTQLVGRSAYAYEPGDRLATITYTQGATSLATYSWGWDGADRITSQTIHSQGFTAETSTYGYNFRNELTGATNNFTGNEGYIYDGTGNRVNAPYAAPGPNNELTNDGTYAYTHDNEGNRKTKIGTGVTATYTWDHRNRLTKVESTVSSTTTTVEYTYDMMDRRIERKVNSSATHRWGYDDDAIALEFDGANTLTHRYLHGPVIDQVFADEAVGVATRWTLGDHLGTVRDVVDNNGANVKHRKYDSFGKQTSDSAPTIPVLYSFTGREYDVETELQYNRARWYDPKVGRWLSTDPIGFDAGDSNLYRYVNNAPINLTDPFGMQEAFTYSALNLAYPENQDGKAGFRFHYTLVSTPPKGGATGILGAIKRTSLGIWKDGKTVAAFTATKEEIKKGVYDYERPKIRESAAPNVQYATDNVIRKDPHTDRVGLILTPAADQFVMFIIKYEFTHGLINKKVNVAHNTLVEKADYEKALSYMHPTTGDASLTYLYLNIKQAEQLKLDAKKIVEVLGKEGNNLLGDIDLVHEMGAIRTANKSALEYFSWLHSGKSSPAKPVTRFLK